MKNIWISLYAPDPYHGVEVICYSKGRFPGFPGFAGLPIPQGTVTYLLAKHSFHYGIRIYSGGSAPDFHRNSLTPLMNYLNQTKMDLNNI